MIKIRREQIAGMNMHYKYRTLDYFFKTQQALGIKNIEFWCARPHFLLDDYGFEDAAELKKNAADYGLTIGAFSKWNPCSGRSWCESDGTQLLRRCKK